MPVQTGHRKRHAALLAANPNCIYCGQAANSVEHMPPRILFDDKLRPKGLEFPACKACNEGTGAADQAVALLARAMTNPRGDSSAPDMPKLMSGVKNNMAPLLMEMRPTPEQMARVAATGMNGKPLNVGPLLHAYVSIFLAKLGMAVYHEVSGARLPDAGAVRSTWYSNFDRVTNSIPDGVFQDVGDFKMLRQGQQNSAGQFEYSYAVTEGLTAAKVVATFRFSFLGVMFVAADAGLLAGPELEESEVRPGGLLQRMPALPAST